MRIEYKVHLKALKQKTPDFSGVFSGGATCTRTLISRQTKNSKEIHGRGLVRLHSK